MVVISEIVLKVKTAIFTVYNVIEFSLTMLSYSQTFPFANSHRRYILSGISDFLNLCLMQIWKLQILAVYNNLH